MRTLIEIHNDIADVQKRLRELRIEKEEFQASCPHPDNFVTRNISDTEDDCGGPGIYEYSTVSYSCALCEGKFYANYDKRATNQMFGDAPPPTLTDILEGKAK